MLTIKQKLGKIVLIIDRNIDFVDLNLNERFSHSDILEKRTNDKENKILWSYAGLKDVLSLNEEEKIINRNPLYWSQSRIYSVNTRSF